MSSFLTNLLAELSWLFLNREDLSTAWVQRPFLGSLSPLNNEFWNHEKYLRAGFGESKGRAGASQAGLLVLRDILSFFHFFQCFLDDGRGTLFDIVIQFSIQINCYGWHLSIYEEGLPI